MPAPTITPSPIASKLNRMPLPPSASPVHPSDALLSCRLDSVRTLLDALSCIHAPSQKSQESVLTVPQQGGLRFTTEDQAYLQASVSLREDVFSSFHTMDHRLCIKVNLSILMDALNVFANEMTPLQIVYPAHGHPLTLVLDIPENENYHRVKTIDGAKMIDFQFHTVPCYNSAIIQSEVLREALAELHFAGANNAEIRMAPSMPCFRLESGVDSFTGASCAVDFPDPDDRSSYVYGDFKSKKVQLSAYRLPVLKRSIKALSISDTTKIRMNDEGMLSIVVKLKLRSPGTIFVEFLIAADEIDDIDQDL